MEDPDLNPHNYNHLNFDKKIKKKIHRGMGKRASLTIRTGKAGYSYEGEQRLGHIFQPIPKAPKRSKTLM